MSRAKEYTTEELQKRNQESRQRYNDEHREQMNEARRARYAATITDERRAARAAAAREYYSLNAERINAQRRAARAAKREQLATDQPTI